MSGSPFPPRGPLGWFPRFVGTMRNSDFSSSVPRHFVSFVRRYRHRLVCSLRAFASPIARPGLVERGSARIRDGNDEISQVPVRPSVFAPSLSDPG